MVRRFGSTIGVVWIYDRCSNSRVLRDDTQEARPSLRQQKIKGFIVAKAQNLFAVVWEVPFVRRACPLVSS